MQNGSNESMKLLIEDAYAMDSEVIEEINESTGDKQKNYYIHGTFSTPDQKNRNGRVYSTKLWENAISGWRDKVKADNKYRLGELEHPTRVDPDPMKAVIKITSLRLEEGIVKGRAKILNDNSPETNKMKALIDEGIKIGVSSRGTGRMKGNIVEEFNLSTYDVVQSPSDYNAMLSGIVESVEDYVYMNESTGKWVCDAKGCSLENETKIVETTCNKNANSLLESLRNYTKVTKVLSENEIKARALLGLDEGKEDFKKAKDLFWEGANAMKKAMDDDKLSKQLSDALSDVSEVLSAYYDSIKKVNEGENAPLADKLLAMMKDTKEQSEFQKKNGSVYKMDKEELEKFIKAYKGK